MSYMEFTILQNFMKFVLGSVIILTTVLLYGNYFCIGSDVVCSQRKIENGNIVCVCNSTYCDTVQSIKRTNKSKYWIVTSTQDGQRFNKTSGNFSKKLFQDGDLILTVNTSQTFQSILGFGGAITDAAAITITNLTKGARERLLKSYFSTDGIEYTFGRVPIGGSDFSTRPYTYDDNPSSNLNATHFSLAKEDLNYKIPIIQQALGMSSRPVKMFGSPWSAPAWMKTNNQLIGKGSLKGDVGGEYYQGWADYYVRFLNAYKDHNITFWGVTAQNEPQDGNTVDFSFNCMGFTAESQRIFIGKNLGPTFTRTGYGDVKIMILDDQRLMLPGWAKEVLRNDSEAKDYVDGIAFHWYLNTFVPAELLTKTHQLFPDKFLLASEACEGSQPFQRKMVMGSWYRGESYASDIIDDLNHWTAGWVDWNICLDFKGGPNWANNAVDSPIIVSIEKDEFYKQPMYYTLGHFSKFILPGSVVINISSSQRDSTLEYVGVKNSDYSTVLVILNRSDNAKNITIYDETVGYITTELPPRSIQTLIWWT